MLESLGMSCATTADTMEQVNQTAEELDDEDAAATTAKPDAEADEEEEES